MRDDIGTETLVYVEWQDSSSAQGWKGPHDLEELATGAHEMSCWSSGLLVEESDDRIVISTSLNSLDDAVDPLAIPKRAITRIKRRTVAAAFRPARKEAR